MAVNRISNINIKDRGLFTAIYGNVNEEEYFVDDDLKNYTLSQALYLYLKSEGYNSVVFYDTTDNFHSFSQKDILSFLYPDTQHSNLEKQNEDEWEISGPLGKESSEPKNTTALVSEKIIHDTIMPVDTYGLSDSYYGTYLTENLLGYLKTNLPKKTKCAVIFTRPESSTFEKINDYVDFFSKLNKTYGKNKVKDEIQNKVIVIYGSNNSHALMDNINRLNGFLFTHTDFKDLFFKVEGDKYKIKEATTFQIGFPEQKEIRCWINRKRILEQTDIFNSVPFDKINLRLTQERKQIMELDNLDLPTYISNINTKSAWDLLNELRGIEEIKVQFQKLITSRKKNNERSKKVRTRPHMCFKGSPGTGKTTVAEIFSEILKEENVLELGQLVKVTVGDLVGEYVGATRIKTQSVCDKAKGGVLFIDEAYGLLDNSENGFGKEAIEVLIQFMENNEDSLVILAGYTDKIDKLLKEGNDGFTSRFNKSNHFLFNDYSADVLFEIAKEKLKEFATTNEFLESVKQILTVLLSRKNAQWGNAREVENLIQEIIIEFDNTDDEVIDEKHIPIHYQNLVKAIEGREGTFTGLLKLNELIGLNQMKSSLRGILNSIKADKLRAEHSGTTSSGYKLNFVFRGNPGTGKTKVARFLGEILSEIGLLNDSEPIECRREDIVAGYVGQTAPRVKQKFIDAIGKVLFIDEAYAICIGEHDQFGKEAVNAIVGNLTDTSFQGKMAFVIAGYPDDIDEFIQQNQGLNRRFNYFIDFEDYSNEELWQIFKVMVKEQNLKVVEDCRDLAVGWFSQFQRIKGFENAGLSERLLGITKSNLDTRIANASADERKFPEFLNTILKIDFPNFNSDLKEEAKPIQPVLPATPTEEIPVTIVEKPTVVKEEVRETLKPPTALEAAKKQLLYDYCIIDTNIWMETRKIKVYQGRIGTLKNLYSSEQKKLVAHGSTYEELKKFADSPTRNEKSNAAYGALKMMKQFHKEKIILIPGLKSTYDADAYADKDIYDFATEEYQKGKSILFITNDNDCNIRVSSSLEGLKSNNPSLPNFDVLDMEQISNSVDLIYEKLFKAPRK
jgi:AAA+ superfamily predicted ATPase